jgi:hypothetical protein
LNSKISKLSCGSYPEIICTKQKTYRLVVPYDSQQSSIVCEVKLKIKQMKKIVICLMAVLLTLTILPVQAFAHEEKTPSTTLAPAPKETAEAVEAKALMLRLDEIKNMDKDKLTVKDKKALHKEVRNIKRELKDISGGVYLSAGTIIVILILLILLT